MSLIEKPCTCHPDDATKPCQRKYAASECQAALTAIMDAGDGVQGWQDISTAPKDGTPILVVGGYSGKEQFVAEWTDMEAADRDEPWYAPNWQWTISDGKNEPIHLRVAYTLTHWQPLRTPPEATP